MLELHVTGLRGRDLPLQRLALVGCVAHVHGLLASRLPDCLQVADLVPAKNRSWRLWASRSVLGLQH